MKKPKKYKSALMIWLALYPSLNLANYALEDFLKELHPLMKTLVLTGILVPLLVFVLVPWVSSFFKEWLER